jgi:hypothetical protein
MVDAEFKMLQALKDAGLIANQGSHRATIRVPGFPDITYIKSAYNLRDGRVTKDKAHRHMSAIRKSYTTPRALYAIRAGNSAARAAKVTAAEDPDYEYGFFIKAVDLPPTSLVTYYRTTTR